MVISPTSFPNLKNFPDMHFFVLILLIIATLIASVQGRTHKIPKANLPSALYPKWAHKHWVWLSNHVETQQREIDFVNNFLTRNISVGAVNIDSTWSTGINNFVWDTAKFPNASAMIDHFHNLDIKVLAWATSVISYNSPNYQEGCDAGYYLEDCAQVKWWHPDGSFLDYTNPKALEWWHKQMDPVLDIGLDGWKNDGTDALIFELGGIAWSSYSERFITEREYANLYYRDFFDYTRSKRPDSLTMNRPVDSWRFIYLQFAPRDVVFSGWVGDQDPTLSGLQDALRNMFHSAWDNYLNFGSDTGGYRDGTRTKETFIRWSQVSAFCPLFENGGEGNHGPWEYDQQTVIIYRDLVNIHRELAPYFLSHATERYAQEKSMMQPMAEETDFTPDSWDFLMGPDIFVCPIVETNATSPTRTVVFPKGNNWVDWWTQKTYQGGSSQTFSLDTFARFPVFRRAGSIIPMDVESDDSLNGDSSMNKETTLLITQPTGAESLRMYEWRKTGLVANYTAHTDRLEVQVSAHDTPVVLLLRGLSAPVAHVYDVVHSAPVTRMQGVSLGDLKVTAENTQLATWMNHQKGLFIRFPRVSDGISVVVQYSS